MALTYNIFVSQLYVEKMRTELASADTSILDHSVESVLPGVHHYLSSMYDLFQSCVGGMLSTRFLSPRFSRVCRTIKQICRSHNKFAQS